MLFVSECTECSPQELSTASCSSQRDNTCTHIPPLVTILNVALVLSCSSTIIPSVLISNYALLAIYPVTVPNQANYNQYHDHVLLGHALINNDARGSTLRDQKSHFTNAVWIQTSWPEHRVDNAAKTGY